MLAGRLISDRIKVLRILSSSELLISISNHSSPTGKREDFVSLKLVDKRTVPPLVCIVSPMEDLIGLAECMGEKLES